MKQVYGTIIVGGGLVGCATACGVAADITRQFAELLRKNTLGQLGGVEEIES